MVNNEIESVETNGENIYDVDTQIEGVEEKKRYTKVEKAKITLEIAQRVEMKKEVLRQNLLELVEDEICLAKMSNNTDMQKYAETLQTKLVKILG